MAVFLTCLGPPPVGTTPAKSNASGELWDAPIVRGEGSKVHTMLAKERAAAAQRSRERRVKGTHGTLFLLSFFLSARLPAGSSSRKEVGKITKLWVEQPRSVYAKSAVIVVKPFLQSLCDGFEKRLQLTTNPPNPFSSFLLATGIPSEEQPREQETQPTA